MLIAPKKNKYGASKSLPSPAGKMATSVQTLGHPQTTQTKGNPKAEFAQVTGATKQLLSVGYGRWEHLAPHPQLVLSST